MSAPDLDERHRPLLGLALAAVVGGLLLVAVVGLPSADAALPALARQALTVAEPAFHTTEPVSEVVYGTRGFDTFGETFLLLAAVVSVVLVTRGREHRAGFVGESAAAREERRRNDADAASGDAPADPEEREAREADVEESGESRRAAERDPDGEPLGAHGPVRSDQMSVVVRSGVRVAAPLLSIVALYLVGEGYTPGGGFPAGVAVLGVVLLVYAAYGYRRIRGVVRPAVMEVVELAGAMALVVVEALGLVLKGSFSANWIPLAPQETLRSGGVIQAFSGSEFVEVGTGLVIVVFAVLGMRNEWVSDDGTAGDDTPDAGNNRSDRGGGR